MASARPGRSAKPSASGAAKQNTQPGLLDCVRGRFVKDVFDAASSANPGWKILVVDKIAMKVISAAVGMYDIMERKVTLVESLEKKRAPFPDMSAIYVLAPTRESIDRLLADFADKKRILYGQNIFVYFLGTIPAAYIDQIKKSKYLIRRLKALSEINVDFLVREQRAFVLDTIQPFSGFYLRNAGSPVEVTIADKLVTVCATLNEYPYIRYNESSSICNSLASIFKMKMDEFVGANPSWWYHGSGKSGNKNTERDRSTILLLDRVSDCLTPLMHDFTYQAMVNDLLKIEGDKITYATESADNPSKKEDKDVLLNEKDQLWVEMRGQHIAKVVEVLSARIQEVVNSSTNSALSKKDASGANMTLSQLASALKELPEYREVMSKLSQHMHLAYECMGVFNRDGLLDLGEIEQTLATGKDEDGRSPKLDEMVNKVEGSLIRTHGVDQRLRQILITIISQNGLKAGDKERLLRAAQLNRDALVTLDKLPTLGIKIDDESEGDGNVGARFFGGKSKVQGTGSFDDDSEYASSRYVPPLKSTLMDLVSNQLSIDDYPSVVPMPQLPSTKSTGAASARRRGKGADGTASARKKKGATEKWNRTGTTGAATKTTTTFTGGRNIVFMVGGLSFSELRVAREVMEKESREIIVGSTKFLSPNEFMKDLATLNKA